MHFYISWKFAIIIKFFEIILPGSSVHGIVAWGKNTGLEFPSETGLILRCAGKVGTPCMGESSREAQSGRFTFMHGRRKWQPTPMFLPREPQGLRGLVGCHLWRGTGSASTEPLSSCSRTPLASRVVKALHEGALATPFIVWKISQDPRQPTRLPRPWDSPGKNTETPRFSPWSEN